MHCVELIFIFLLVKNTAEKVCFARSNVLSKMDWTGVLSRVGSKIKIVDRPLFHVDLKKIRIAHLLVRDLRAYNFDRKRFADGHENILNLVRSTRTIFIGDLQRLGACTHWISQWWSYSMRKYWNCELRTLMWSHEAFWENGRDKYVSIRKKSARSTE